MMTKIFGFIWEHFWKLVSFTVTTGFITFVAMVQSPAQVEARISSLESNYSKLHDNNVVLTSRVMASDVLFNKVDTKLDRMNESIIVLTEQLRRANQP